MSDPNLLDPNLPTTAPAVKSPTKFSRWFKRIGLLGFLFFLVKGLIWLAVLFGIGKCVA